MGAPAPRCFSHVAASGEGAQTRQATVDNLRMMKLLCMNSPSEALLLPRRPHVGDHVRVRQGVGQTLACNELPHYPQEQECTGEIIADRAQMGAPGHPFLVLFDELWLPSSIVGRPMLLPTRHYAADEFDLLA
jgi:hypothetical protein